MLRARALDRSLPLDVDSCGTGGGSNSWANVDGFSYHEGERSDARMRATAKERGIDIECRSRPLVPSDLEGEGKFDFVIGMDSSNIREMERARELWIADGRCTKESKAVQWSLMNEYSPEVGGFRGKPVPDPYYLGTAGFETALDLIEGAADGVLDDLYGPGAEGVSEWGGMAN